LDICGTNAACPFEGFEESWALNMGFVTGASLEAIERLWSRRTRVKGMDLT